MLEGGIFGPEDGSPPQQVTGALRADLLELLGRFENEKERPRLPMELVKSLAELELLLGSGEQSADGFVDSLREELRKVLDEKPA